MRALTSAQASQQYEAFQERYFDQPDQFMLDCVAWPQGGGPAPYQLDTAIHLVTYRREAVKGPRRLGKTADASLLLLWFALTRDRLYDWKILITAGVGRQVNQYFWPEVHRWARRLKWDVIGRQPLDFGNELMYTSLRLATGLAFGAVSDRPDLIEGAGAPQFLVILDESKSISADVFDTLEAAMVDTADSQSYALALSTPGKPSGRFYDLFAKKPGFEHWHTSSVTIEDAVRAGRRTQAEVDRLKAMWGEHSVTYRAFVLGEFAADDEDALIKLAWIEAAIERGRQWRAAGRPGSNLLDCLGVDVGLSRDKTVFARRFGKQIDDLIYHDAEDPEIATMITAGHITGLLRSFGGGDKKGPKAIIDADGIGVGVYHRVREQGYRGQAFNAGAGTELVDRTGTYGFVNVRSAAWWTLREMLDPAFGEEIGLPDDDILIGDLTALHFSYTSGGKISVEKKDDVKARIGRSTDAADSVVQAFWQEPEGIYFR